MPLADGRAQVSAQVTYHNAHMEYCKLTPELLSNQEAGLNLVRQQSSVHTEEMLRIH